VQSNDQKILFGGGELRGKLPPRIVPILRSKLLISV
jgi:hypothetical protein